VKPSACHTEKDHQKIGVMSDGSSAVIWERKLLIHVAQNMKIAEQ
jgi:hypothetical protein